MSACGRAQKLMEARDEGEHLLYGEDAFLTEHLKTCAACALEERALATLRFAPEDASPFPVTAEKRHDLVERALVAAAWPAREEHAERAEVVPWWRSLLRPRFALALAGVTTGILALFVIARPLSSAEALPGQVVLASTTDGTRAARPLVLDEEIVAHGSELALALGPDVVALLEPGGHLRVHRLDSAGIDLELAQGVMHVSATPGALAEALTVALPDGRVVVTGTIFTVDARTIGTTGSDLRVQRGSVRVEPKAGARAAVKAGHGRALAGGVERQLGPEETSRGLEAVARAERLARAPAGATVVAPLVPTGPVTGPAGTLDEGDEEDEEDDAADALAAALRDDDDALADDEDPPQAKRVRPGRRGGVEEAEVMLERAQNLRAERRWRGAATTYRQLIRRFPQEPAARIARVSLGTLLLDHLGKPREALALCSAYLRSERGGVVAQEAAYCRIGAFRALGREARERQAIEAFLLRYPGAVQLDELRARLKELPKP